jgi:hypothetical protein
MPTPVVLAKARAPRRKSLDPGRRLSSMVTVSFNGLLGDEFSKTVHSAEQIVELRGQTNIVAEIALFVLFRTQGSACCSCSCSCWGKRRPPDHRPPAKISLTSGTGSRSPANPGLFQRSGK